MHAGPAMRGGRLGSGSGLPRRHPARRHPQLTVGRHDSRWGRIGPARRCCLPAADHLPRRQAVSLDDQPSGV